MANHLGKRYRAVVELGGIEIAEEEEFTVTQKHLDGADFDFLLNIGAIEPIGRPKPDKGADIDETKPAPKSKSKAKPKSKPALPAAGDEPTDGAKDEAAEDAAGGSNAG